MKTTIIIECDTGAELLAHLHVLKLQARKAIKAANKSGVIRKPIILQDNNCYGMHEAKIKEFSGDDLFTGIKK